MQFSLWFVGGLSLPRQQVLAGLSRFVACGHITARAAQAGVCPLPPPLLSGFGMGRVAFTFRCVFVERGWVATTVGALKCGMCRPIASVYWTGFQTPVFRCSPCSSPFQRLQLRFTHCCPFLLRSAARGGARPPGSRSVSTTSLQGWRELSHAVLVAFLRASTSQCPCSGGKSRCRSGGAALGFPCISSLRSSVLFWTLQPCIGST